MREIWLLERATYGGLLLSTDPRLLDLLARYRYAHELAAEGQRDLTAMLGESTGGLPRATRRTCSAGRGGGG